MSLDLKDSSANKNNYNQNMDKKEQEIFCGNINKYFREYSATTSIHGFHYLTDNRSSAEKTTWILLLLLSLSGCLYMIYEILMKYHNSPVVVSFATEDTPIYEIPFPAVTICPEAKYSKEKFNYSEIFFQIVKEEKVDQDGLEKFSYLNLVCDQPNMNISVKGNMTVKNNFYTVLDELQTNASLMLPQCYFMNPELKLCEELFTPIIIDQGICYSFNIIGRHEIFRSHVFHYEQYYQVKNNSKGVFDKEEGFNPSAGLDTYPRRGLMSGADNALTIMFRYPENASDFSCNYFRQGFRVLIHNPWNVPRLSKHFFSVPFDKVVVAAIEPELITTSKKVSRFKPEKRMCYMKNERPLKHFQQYSQSNCLFECLTNYTLELCGCVRFFMPRESNTPICGIGATDCLEQAESEVKIKELESKRLERSWCDCKPSCTNLNFRTSISMSNLYWKQFVQDHKNDRSHWSVLEIYFAKEQFMSMERNELYGISDLISNLGGLLGLFTGFSLISLAEIFYFCSLRMYINKRIYGKWLGKSN